MGKLTPTASYGIVIRCKYSNETSIESILSKDIEDNNIRITKTELIKNQGNISINEITIDAVSEKKSAEVIEVIKKDSQVELESYYDRTFKMHEGGKLSVESRYPLNNTDDLSMAYTPGVARICNSIKDNLDLAYDYTIKKNIVAVVTDGSAVLGLGNIGSLAGMPVMEGKAVLFKEFANVDAFPICLDTQDTEEIIKTVKMIAPGFGGINLEDISAPRCFEIEARLKQALNIPVFHDDQHGTAIVTLAALKNALLLLNKSIAEVKIVINGAGAAGVTVGRLLRLAGAKNIVMCDSKGILFKGRNDLNYEKKEFEVGFDGSLEDAMLDTDVFIGLSVPNIVSVDMVKSMNENPIIFAMSNPIPEIQPELIYDIAGVVATGRSDYPNQINNVLAFPGIFRGVLDCKATSITTSMHIEAANAISRLISKDELSKDYVIPGVFDKRVAPAVANAVIDTFEKSN